MLTRTIKLVFTFATFAAIGLSCIGSALSKDNIAPKEFNGRDLDGWEGLVSCLRRNWNFPSQALA
jgi:hypothetical protein